MDVKIIKTDAEYEAALSRIEALMDADPDSPQEEELELLALLVEKFEEERYPIDLPDPVEAIKFRMEQEGLTPKDLIKYLGSQSKVSEVLNYRRPLSLSMIRNLHEGLGIPAEVLLQPPKNNNEKAVLPWREYPFAEIFKRGYFQGFEGDLLDAKTRAEELLNSLFSSFGGLQPRQIYCMRAERDIDLNALTVWQARALQIALQEELPVFSREELTEDFIRQMVQLSYFSQGIQMAQELLNNKGIHFVILPHLPKTYLDGACFYAPDQRPVIGMTLRHDRLDNFWFTLVHELAHLFLHFDERQIAFFDDTEQPVEDPAYPQENEANELTCDMLVPPAIWDEVSAQLITLEDEQLILETAERLSISPAIVAGRVRLGSGDYSHFTNLVGYKTVRVKFSQYS